MTDATQTGVRHTLMGLADTAVEAGTITEGKYLEIADYLKDNQEITEPPIDLNYPETMTTASALLPRRIDFGSHLILPEEITGGTQDEASQYLQSLSRNYLSRKREREILSNENNFRQSQTNY